MSVYVNTVTHFLISYDFYDDIRYELFELAGQIYLNFINLSPGNKMVFVMQTQICN